MRFDRALVVVAFSMAFGTAAFAHDDIGINRSNDIEVVSIERDGIVREI